MFKIPSLGIEDSPELAPENLRLRAGNRSGAKDSVIEFRKWSSAVKEEFCVFGRMPGVDGLEGGVDGPVGEAVTDGSDDGGKDEEKQDDSNQYLSFHGTVLSFPSMLCPGPHGRRGNAPRKQYPI